MTSKASGLGTLIGFKQIRARVRREYNRLRDDYEFDGHPSHAASEAMRRILPDLIGGFGAEGFCDECGREGVTYWNMGDTYDTTICFTSWNERFFVSCWGDCYELYAKRLGLE